MSARKKAATKAAPRKPRDSKRELVRKQRLPGLVYKRSEMHEIEQDLRNQETIDRIELKLTKWWDGHGRGARERPHTIGDLLLSMAGVDSCDPKGVWHIGQVFFAVAGELEVMAEHEMAHRRERQASQMVYRSDLYSQLLHTAQRCRTLGEVLPRIIKANGLEVAQ